MAINTRRLLDIPVLEIEPYTFEHVHAFTYLGTIPSKDNNITEEVQNKIAVATGVISTSRNTLNLILYPQIQIFYYIRRRYVQ
jgi:hypothetical protein